MIRRIGPQAARAQCKPPAFGLAARNVNVGVAVVFRRQVQPTPTSSRQRLLDLKNTFNLSRDTAG
jgi:hypothetical protein